MFHKTTHQIVATTIKADISNSWLWGNTVIKGEVSQTTMWIGWVESNFTNPTVKVWADLDNPFKSSDYPKLCMLPSLDRTLPQYVISQEDNSPLTLYVEIFTILNFSWISIVLLIQFIHKLCMHIHLSPNIPMYKEEGKYIFMKSKILYKKKIVYSSIRQLYCCDITDIRRVPPERATYTKLMKPLKNHISWLDYPNLPKLFAVRFLK